jgi:hypothetical protein
LRHAAEQLVGERLLSVTYVDIDYRRHEVAAGHVGPRQITDSDEWVEPTWRFSGCDSVDYGVELRTGGNRPVTLTWDLPGDEEGLGLHFLPLVPTFVSEDADVAVWDVSRCSQWAPLIGTTVGGIELHYRDWYTGKFWCPRITVTFGEMPVEFLLGDADTVTGGIRPSSDNVAVVMPGGTLPSWIA